MMVEKRRPRKGTNDTDDTDDTDEYARNTGVGPRILVTKPALHIVETSTGTGPRLARLVWVRGVFEEAEDLKQIGWDYLGAVEEGLVEPCRVCVSVDEIEAAVREAKNRWPDLPVVSNQY